MVLYIKNTFFQLVSEMFNFSRFNSIDIQPQKKIFLRDNSSTTDNSIW